VLLFLTSSSKTSVIAGNKTLINHDAAAITKSENRDDLSNPVTPFPRYAHHSGQSFEPAGRFRLNSTDHADLVHGDPNNEGWISSVSDIFNVHGSRKPYLVAYGVKSGVF
jgi:hypothetical protein